MPLQHDDLLRRFVQVAGESLPLADEHGDLALQVLLTVDDHVDLQRVERELRKSFKMFVGGAPISVSYDVNLRTFLASGPQAAPRFG